MKIIVYCLFFIGVPLLFLFLIGSIRSWQVETDPRQRYFLKGSVSEKMPDGFYKGKFEGRRIAWKGKDFNAQTRMGVNIIGKEEKRDYPFMFYKAYGLQDTKKEILRIDYDFKDNPFWLRFFKDEIVEVKQGEYLGKIHLIIPPHLVFTLAYFTLTK